MISLLLSFLIFAPFLVRNDEEFGRSVIDLMTFQEDDETADWNVERPLEIEDRSLVDYDTRESHPYVKVCEVQFNAVSVRDLDPAYDYKHYPMYDAKCVSSDVSNPLNYSRHEPHKDFCIIKHQKFADDPRLCQTVYRRIPILKKKKESSCWSYDIQKFGVGCKCHIAVKYD